MKTPRSATIIACSLPIIDWEEQNLHVNTIKFEQFRHPKNCCNYSKIPTINLFYHRIMHPNDAEQWRFWSDYLSCLMTKPIICAPSEDSDQPGHPPSLIRVFAVRSMGSWGPKVSSCGQRGLRSDWANVQADLRLRWAHRSFSRFCRAAANFLPKLVCPKA